MADTQNTRTQSKYRNPHAQEPRVNNVPTVWLRTVLVEQCFPHRVVRELFIMLLAMVTHMWLNCFLILVLGLTIRTIEVLNHLWCFVAIVLPFSAPFLSPSHSHSLALSSPSLPSLSCFSYCPSLLI